MKKVEMAASFFFNSTHLRIMLETGAPFAPPTPTFAVGVEPSISMEVPPPIPIAVRQPHERHTWTPAATVFPLPLAVNHQRSHSHNQMTNEAAADGAEDAKAKLSPLKLETVVPTLMFPGTNSSSSVSVTPPQSSPPTSSRLTRRGSIILHATMKAMTAFVQPASTAQELVSSPPRDRLKSNQDSDSDSDSDDSDANLDDTDTTNCANSANSNQRDDSVSAPTPPYFRLRTFLLDDEPHVCEPTSSTTASPRRVAATPSKTAQIDGIFREIWQTEQSYVDALTGLVTRFFEPLQTFAKQHDIALGAMAALCHSTTTILSIHQELIRQLAPLQQPHANSVHTNSIDANSSDANPSSPDPFGVGFTGTLARLHLLSRAFLSTIEYMKVYAFYCGSYLSAKQELERLQRQHPRLAAFTAQLNETALRGSQEEGGSPSSAPLPPPLDINSNLIKPVQRICRYPLLFKSLLANASSPEEELVLQQSLQKIQAVSNYVNDKVREAQNNARLYQLHQMLPSSSSASGGIELLQPSRTLLHEAWANVTSLDAPRWPTKLLRHFRRRGGARHHQTGRRRSSLRDDWARLSMFRLGDDRRSSATVTANILKSQASSQGGGGGGGRNTSFSNASTNGEYSSPPPTRLLRRRSSGGERSRLILLSDMLLMAKLKDRQLKVRRQICLSCAVIHDDAPPPPPPTEEGDEADDTADDALLSPRAARTSTGAAAVAVVSALSTSHAFTLEVSKVGQCSCHHFSPLTLKRSPRLGGLTAFLSGRRGSMSVSTAAELVPASSSGRGGGEPRSRSPSSQRMGSSRSSKSGSRFRYLEQLAGLRSSKRYRISCDSPLAKTELLLALRQAIERSARLVSIGGAAGGGGGGGGGSSATSSRVRAEASSDTKVANLPARIWRTLVRGAAASVPRREEEEEEEEEKHGGETDSPVPPLSRRQRDSLTIVCSGRGGEGGDRRRTPREADLLHLEDDPRRASVEEAAPVLV